MALPEIHYAAWRWALLTAFVLVTGALVYWLAARPTRPTSRLGMRGMKRQLSLLRYPLWGSLEPLVRWLGVYVSGILSSASRSALDAQLTYAGDYLGMTPDEYFACMLLGGAGGAVVGGGASWFLGGRMGIFPIVIAVALGLFVPYLVVDSARATRFKAISRGLPYAVDLMALSMSAGLDFPASIQQVVDKAKANEALREELAYMLQQLQLGRTRSQALRELSARVPLESVREFAQSLVQAEERGNPVAAVLEVQAAMARTRRSNQAEKAATDMRAKMVLPTMMLIAVGLTLIAVPSGMMLEKFTGGMGK